MTNYRIRTAGTLLGIFIASASSCVLRNSYHSQQILVKPVEDFSSARKISSFGIGIGLSMTLTSLTFGANRRARVEAALENQLQDNYKRLESSLGDNIKPEQQ